MLTNEYIDSVYVISKTIESSVDDYINNEIMKISMGKDSDQSKDDALKYILALVFSKSEIVIANGVVKNTKLGYSHVPIVKYATRKINGATLSDRLSLSLDRLYEGIAALTNTEKLIGIAALSLKKVNDVFIANKTSVTEPINPVKNIHRNTRGEMFYTMREADSITWVAGGAGGVLVSLNPAHPKTDMCDDLAGIYPIDFVFYGWHPSCMCIAEPVNATVADMPSGAVQFYSEKEKWYKSLSSFKLNKGLWNQDK